MRLKENFSYTYQSGVLNVFDEDRHVLRQPYDSETGEAFKNIDDSLRWLLLHYPDMFTPT